MADPQILAAALELREHGYSVIPIMGDGSKAPAIAWKKYATDRPANDGEIRSWFREGTHDLGVVQGAISGNAELTEVEGRAAANLPALRELAHDTGLGDLWDTITTGWVEQSPSGGFHFHYRLDGTVPGNLKLARDANGLVLAETRGEGGQVVVAPSRHHDTGRPWVRLLGGPATAPTLSPDDRDAFHTLLRTLDQTPVRDNPTPAQPVAPRDPGDGITPGDDFENRTDWPAILTPHGWTLVFTGGRTRYWRRPGKNRGISATTGHADDRDRLYVFTSSTDFAQEVPYTKLGAYALLEHGGDHTAAAKALYADGYGQQAREHTLRLVTHPEHDDLTGLIAPTERPHPTPSPQATRASTHTDGSLALAEPVATITEHRMTLTDVGNAQLLVAKHSHHIRYVAGLGFWLIWDGHHWATDHAGAVVELAKQVILDIGTDDQAATKHRTRSLSRRAIEAMVALARTDPTVAVTPERLDAIPTALCTPAGVVDLRTGTLSRPDPEHLHTRSTLVGPDPTMQTPRWNAFLADTFAGRTDIIEFVQRLAGYSATGAVTHHILPFLLGPGGNGKSVFLDVLRALLGDYAGTTPAKFLMAGVTQHETEIARLSGLRLVIASEVNEEDRFDEAKMKLLTGGDALTARFMHQNHFTFVPTHHLWLMGNHQPRVTSGGDSFWRRLRLVPFNQTVPEERRIDGLDKILVSEEGPGILSWIVAGAVKAFAGGLSAPDAVKVATSTYAAEEDHLARFVEDRIQLGGGTAAREATAAIRRAYETWCRDQGERGMSPQAFGRELRTRFGIEQSKSNGVRFYVGMTLLNDESEPEEPAEWWDK